MEKECLWLTIGVDRAQIRPSRDVDVSNVNGHHACTLSMPIFKLPLYIKNSCKFFNKVYHSNAKTLQFLEKMHCASTI